MQFLEKAGRLNRAIEYPAVRRGDRRAPRAGRGPDQRPSARCCSPTARCGSTTSCWPRRCPTIRGSRPRSRATSRALLRERFAAYMPRHPLKREIIATHVHEQHDQPRRQHLRAPAVRDHRRARRTRSCAPICWRARSSASSRCGRRSRRSTTRSTTRVQSAMLIDTSRQLERGTTWFLRSRRLADDMAATIALLHAGRRGAVGAAADAARRRTTRARVDAAVGALRGAGRAARAGRARGHVRHAVRHARHRRGRRRDAAGRSSWSRRSTSSCPTGSACRGCARRSRRCRATRIGRCSPRARCTTTCRACSARSPAKC